VNEREERSYILNENNQSAYRRLSRSVRTRGSVKIKDVVSTLGLDHMWPDDLRSRRCCTGYATSILLDRARQLGPDHPYLAALLENQIRMIRSYWVNESEDSALSENWRHIPDVDGQLNKLAKQDLAYLSATAHFYAKRYDEALEGYATVAGNGVSPHRDAGRLMEIRVLRALNKSRIAHDLVRQYKIEADGIFKEWLDQQEDLIARKSNIPEFRMAHLEKVFRRAYKLPVEGEPDGFRRAQAAYDFETYFLYEHDRKRWYKKDEMPHDWWLRPEAPAGTTAFAAVHALSKRYDEIDWIAARHASQAFVRDNTWFAGPDLDIADPAYGRVTKHAYRKWQEDGLDHWAAIVAARIDGDSPYADDITAFVREMQNRAQTCSLSPSEYVLYTAVYRHAVRIAASAGDYELAFVLLKNANQIKFYPRVHQAQSVNRAFVNLLMIHGEFELMQQFQSEVAIDPRASLWLAKTPEDLLKFGQANIGEFINMLDDDDIWMLLTLKNDRDRSFLSRENEASFARVLWMRGYVFKNEEVMARAEPLLLKHYPSLHPYFRHAAKTSSGKGRRRIFAHMILKNPGLSPFAYEGARKRKKDLTVILSRDPIEGNWWCSGEDRQLVQDNEQALAEIFFTQYFGYSSPINAYDLRQRYRIYAPTQTSAARKMIVDAWGLFRKEYAPFKMISEEAQARLAELPRGPAYLGREVRQWTHSPAGVADWILQRDDRIPESLHRVVLATRTSCHTLEKGNKITSIAAFQTLHRRYGRSLWAARTPYWFDRIGYHRR